MNFTKATCTYEDHTVYFIWKGNTIVKYNPFVGRGRIIFSSKYEVVQYCITERDMIVSLQDGKRSLCCGTMWYGNWLNQHEYNFKQFHFLRADDGDFITKGMYKIYYDGKKVVQCTKERTLDYARSLEDYKWCNNFNGRVPVIMPLLVSSSCGNYIVYEWNSSLYWKAIDNISIK